MNGIYYPMRFSLGSYAAAPGDIHRTYQPLDPESKSSNSFVVRFGLPPKSCATFPGVHNFSLCTTGLRSFSRTNICICFFLPGGSQVVTSAKTFYMHGPSDKAMLVWIRALVHAVTLVS